MTDNVNHPKHYNNHPFGLECIDAIEHMPCNRAMAIKYVWRAGDKGGPAQEQEDLDKAIWYLQREKQRLTRLAQQADQVKFNAAQDPRYNRDFEAPLVRKAPTAPVKYAVHHPMD